MTKQVLPNMKQIESPNTALVATRFHEMERAAMRLTALVGYRGGTGGATWGQVLRSDEVWTYFFLEIKWLVGGDWNMTLIFPYLLGMGMSSSQFDELIFFRGVETNHQPDERAELCASPAFFWEGLAFQLTEARGWHRWVPLQPLGWTLGLLRLGQPVKSNAEMLHLSWCSCSKTLLGLFLGRPGDVYHLQAVHKPWHWTAKPNFQHSRLLIVHLQTQDWRMSNFFVH